MHRVLGTLVGIAVTHLVLAAEPPAWVLAVAVAAATLVAESFTAHHHGLAVVGITPVAVVTSHLAAPAPIGPTVGDRVVESALGLLVALLLVLAVHALSAPARPAGTVRTD